MVRVRQRIPVIFPNMSCGGYRYVTSGLIGIVVAPRRWSTEPPLFILVLPNRFRLTLFVKHKNEPSPGLQFIDRRVVGPAVVC